MDNFGFVPLNKKNKNPWHIHSLSQKLCSHDSNYDASWGCSQRGGSDHVQTL